MAGDDEVEGEDGPSWMDRLRERLPETGVGLFVTFILAMVIGSLLALFGRLNLSMMVFLVAVIAVLAMLFTPSPAAKARRVAREKPAGEADEVAEEDAEETDVGTRSDLPVDDVPAPTATRRGVPAPPPEPPPMEDIVIDLDEDEGGKEEAPAGDDEDVWVE